MNKDTYKTREEELYDTNIKTNEDNTQLKCSGDTKIVKVRIDS